MNWFTKSKTPAAVKRLEKQLLDLQSKLDAAERTAQVLEAERDTLALVVARDRQRIEAELAAYARQKAENEGTDGRINTGLRHVG